jgi:roadblock/LC7 domain-containing protein
MGSIAMNALDDLVSRHGVIMAGILGPDGRVAAHKSKGMYIENPAALEMAHWFCSALTMMFTSMGAALDRLTVACSWLPMSGWVYNGGDYGIAVQGAHFVFVESAKIDSLDEVIGLLRQLDSPADP